MHIDWSLFLDSHFLFEGNTYRLIRLPLRSNLKVRMLSFPTYRIEFFITIRFMLFIPFNFIWYTPTTEARRELHLFRCFSISHSNLSSFYLSLVEIVLTIHNLSCVKKKKLPEAPPMLEV